MTEQWKNEDERKRFFAKHLRPVVYMNRDKPAKSGGWATTKDITNDPDWEVSIRKAINKAINKAATGLINGGQPMASKKELKHRIKNLQDETKALEQSHKQYQDLCAKIIALMIDELGIDIVRVFVDEHEQPETMAHWGE